MAVNELGLALVFVLAIAMAVVGARLADNTDWTTDIDSAGCALFLTQAPGRVVAD